MAKVWAQYPFFMRTVPRFNLNFLIIIIIFSINETGKCFLMMALFNWSGVLQVCAPAHSGYLVVCLWHWGSESLHRSSPQYLNKSCLTAPHSRWPLTSHLTLIIWPFNPSFKCGRLDWYYSGLPAVTRQLIHLDVNELVWYRCTVRAIGCTVLS